MDLLVRVLSLVLVLTQAAHGLEVVSRAGWGARAPKARTPMRTPVSMVFVHHTATRACTSRAQCSQRVRSIQNYHVNSNGWSDIGYSFLVGEDGRVYEGRGWSLVGAHTLNYNSKSIAISFIGNFMAKGPNEAAVDAALDLISEGIGRGYLTPDVEVFGHRDAGCTSCPGDRLYEEIKTWPWYSDRKLTKAC